MGGKRQYEKRFQDCPFALRLAPPGTSKRLHSWTQKLATSVNERIVPPWLVMRILMCLEAPSATSVDHNTAAASGAFSDTTGLENSTSDKFEIGDLDDESSDDGDAGLPPTSGTAGADTVFQDLLG